jgi:ABC-type amino acid transport substrate-binding protein
MKLAVKDIGVGVLAGLAAALLSIGVITQSPLAMALLLFSPLPIFVAALGWGTAAGLIAAVSMAITVSVIAAPTAALIVVLITAVPAAAAAYFTGLARPAEEIGGPKDTYIWYPIADTLLRVALIVAASFIVIGMLVGFGDDLANELAKSLAQQLAVNNPQLTANADVAQSMALFIVRVMPALQPAVWVTLIVANLYLALRLTAASGRLRRPMDDWPRALRMPRPALIIFAIACAACFVPGGFGYAAIAVAGALAAGFTMAGFAMMHVRTRGAPWRPIALWLAYLAVVLFAFVLFIFLVAGLFDTSRNAPVSKAVNTTPPNNDN